MSFRNVLAATGREVPLPVSIRPWALQDEAARVAAESLEGKFSAGVVATRTVLASSNPAWALPAPALALLLE
jgi:hypothetical protein